MNERIMNIKNITLLECNSTRIIIFWHLLGVFNLLESRTLNYHFHLLAQV